MRVCYPSCLLLLLVALATASCAPSYLLGVRPATPHTLFASDQPAAIATADSVALQLNFIGYEPEWLVFNAEYRNDSRQPIDIQPVGFAYAPLREAAEVPPARRVLPGEHVAAATAAASQRAPWPALPSAPLPALDPEPQISQLQAGASREAARASRPDWMGIALFAVALGVDIASSTRRTETIDQARARAAIHDVAWTYTAISNANRVRHAATAGAMAQRADLLAQYALRRVVLQPGEQVRGYVYLPRFDQADGLRVLAPVGSRQVPLDFVQTHQRR